MTHKRERNKQLNTFDQDLFWNYINLNLGYVQLFMRWIFLHLFFTKKSVAARLHDWGSRVTSYNIMSPVTETMNNHLSRLPFSENSITGVEQYIKRK